MNSKSRGDFHARRCSWLAVIGISLLAGLSDRACAKDWEAREGMTSAEYQRAVEELKMDGLRPVQVCGYNIGAQERFAALWIEAGKVDWEARHNLTKVQYETRFKELLAEGFRLESVSGYTVGGQERFIATWSKTPGPEWAARNSLTNAQYQAAVEEFQKKGFRVQHVAGYTVGGQERYAAIWIKSDDTPWEARHNLTAAQYQQTFNDLKSKGFRPESISGYNVGGQERYAGVWTKSPGPEWQARHAMSPAQYQSAFDEYQPKGFLPLHVTGYSVGNQERFAAIWTKGPAGPASVKDNPPPVIVKENPPPGGAPAAATGSSRP